MAPCSRWDPSAVTGGCTARDLCFCMDVPDSCLPTGADVRGGAGMHSHTSSSTGLGQCGVMEKLSPRLSSIAWHLQLHFDKHIELTRVGSDAEWGDGRAAAAAGRAAQHPQRKIGCSYQALFCSMPRGEADLLVASLPAAGLPRGGCQRPLERWAVSLCLCDTAVGQQKPLHCCSAVLFIWLLDCWHHQSSASICLECYQKNHPNPIIIVSMFLDSRREDLLRDSRNCVVAFCDEHAEFSTT